jgi:putative Mn2+ efflux pump MntP
VEQLITAGIADTPEGPGAFTGKSAVSWPAIFAGAVIAAAATLLLMALGAGLGLASISRSNHSASATTFAVTGAIWLILTQWISAGLGGYIAGRLRTRWIGTHTHEVFFRDTAHGLITWAVATVLVAAVLSSSVRSGVGAAGHAAAEAASGGMQGAMQSTAGLGSPASAGSAAGPASPLSAYSIDKLFRSTGSAGAGPPTDPRTETGHIIADALVNGSVPDADRAYLADQVAARTGISQTDAQARVDAFIASVMQAQQKLKAEADAARKAAAKTSIFLALSMLVGAFIASVAAALGGRLRDEHI